MYEDPRNGNLLDRYYAICYCEEVIKAYHFIAMACPSTWIGQLVINANEALKELTVNRAIDQIAFDRDMHIVAVKESA